VRKELTFLAVVICAVALGALAQGSKHVVEAKTVLAAEGAAPGSTLKAAAVAQIAPGYHINDHKPTMEYLIPTEWKIEGTKEISVEKLAYPKGELKKFAFSEEKLSVYEGALTVGALLRIARTTKPGTYALKGDFKYQACNDHACLPPKSLPLVLTVNVVPRGAAVKRLNAEVFRNVRFE
jgi:hypothetical protein